MRDSGFDCSQEVGFAKIGHRMWDSDEKRKWIMQDFHKKERNQDPPFPDPVLLVSTVGP